MIFDNTVRIKKMCDAGFMETPAIQRGTQNFRAKIGETVESAGNGILKKGVKVKITDIYEQNGFCYYVAGGQTLREKDLF